MTASGGTIRRRTRAFTLIEMLVVVGILAILIAIIMPSISKARQHARTAACLVTVRGLNQTATLYMMEWGRLFPFSDQNSMWVPILPSVEPTTTPAPLVVQGNIDKARLCPEALDPSRFQIGTVSVGYAHAYWKNSPPLSDPYRSSYGINGWLFNAEGTKGNDLTNLRNLSFTGFIPNYLDYFRHFPLQSNQANIPSFGDCCWAFSFPKQTDGAPINFEEPSTIIVSAGTNTMSRFALDRHRLALNVTFLDGHAETVKIRNLWTLRWSANWTRMDPEDRP